MASSTQPRTDKVSETSRFSFITKLVATGFFSGYFPHASGTVGTLVGILVYLIPGVDHPLTLGILILVGFLVGAHASRHVVISEGNRISKTAEFAKSRFQPGRGSIADPSIVVIDEIVGIWITLFLLPKTFMVIILAFLLFRAFDIIKPYPARQLEAIPNGWGIMLDDVVAGIYANIATRVCYYLLQTFIPYMS